MGVLTDKIAEKIANKTTMFGKTYNTVGSSDSNFIIKTKGDLKVLWGNKYIDIIKNGKIASEGSLLLFLVDNPDKIKLNGVYIVDLGNSLELWVCIDGIKLHIDNTINDNVYVSFMTEQTNTSDLKHLALTNIGFYYKTLLDALMDSITSGIIYIEENNKLYIAKNGTLTLYTLENSSTSQTTTESSPTKEPLYILNYSLYADGTEYIQCSHGTIKLLQPIIVYDYIQSSEYTANSGFKLSINNREESLLEIDRIDWRKYPNPITYYELMYLIDNKKLNPKMYYLLIDFLNPWEVTWEGEPFLTEDTYLEINKVKHLSGLRNVTQLIIQAKTNESIEPVVLDLRNPDWVMHYDPFFKGPEHKVMVDGKELVYYGYRTRVKATGETEYLPCKGIITYLKDELGNEGNFNFRQFRFRTQDGKWRYIMDTEPAEILGKFSEGANNKFLLENIDTYIQIFQFEEVYNASKDITGFTMSEIEGNIQIEKGHNLLITSKGDGNYFNLPKVANTIYHIINSQINNNKFINIKEIISAPNNVIVDNNTFQNLNRSLTINIACNDNTLINFKDNVVIDGTSFIENYLTNFDWNILNTGNFEKNIIEECTNLITTKQTFIGNYINSVLADINNFKVFLDNIIESILSPITNNTIFTNNDIGTITKDIINNGTISDNSIVNIVTELTINKDILFTSNTIGTINNLTVGANFINNTINNIDTLTTHNTVSDNTFMNIKECIFNNTISYNVFHGNISQSSLELCTKCIAYKDIVKLTSTEYIYSCIFNLPINNLEGTNLNYCTFEFIDTLVLDKPVYYTTFHGFIGNVTRQLTDFEWDLLQDTTKKKDAYPNIKVVCVPEIIQTGMILMWYSANPIPKGWAICDGSNNTPDLRNRFIRGINTDGSGNITEKSEELDPSNITLEIDPTSGKSISKLELKKENIPNHEHPHYHTIPSTSSTVEIYDDYAYGRNGGTAASGSDIGVEQVIESGETESITITIPDTDLPTYTEGELKDTPDKITIEPKSYIMIFIMKIDENSIV